MSTFDGQQGVHVDSATSTATSGSTATPGRSAPSFVRKLYRMLQNKEHELIVS
ncbi:hypothetical protein BGX31_005255 [Mortierella sp. GBA43]|nr:hypothetical protein BGX31_005255 [Mortierella sp. GBA43]